MKRKLFFSKGRLVLFIILSVFFLSVSAYAESRTGVTRGTGIQLRNEPVNGDIIMRLNSGLKVNIEDETDGRDGVKWYKISSSTLSVNGYVRSDFIEPGGKGADDVESGSTYETVVDGAKIKASPSDDAETLCTLSIGTVCTVTETVFDKNSGYFWFLVTFSPVNGVSKGYIRYDCLNIGNYSSELVEEGFPDSYVPYLSVIHDMYPSWEFKAYNPSDKMTFDECVEAETPISVVPSSVAAYSGAGLRNNDKKADIDSETTLGGSQKGKFSLMMEGNVVINTVWKDANKKTVAYYMDPRNFMVTDSGELKKSFFMFLSGTNTEGTNKEGVKSILSTTSMTGAIPGEGVDYDETVYNKSVENKVNPYLIAARMRLEHGYKDGDDLINGNYSGYEGYYNYFNIKANGDDPVLNGLKYAKEQGWNTRVKSIKAGISFLADNYILSTEHKQETLYKQRFFFKDKSYYHQYMTNLYAPSREAEFVYEGYKEDKSDDSKGVFLIPVYKDMPETPASLQ